MGVLILLAWLGAALAQPAPVSLYNEANALYRQGDYQAARGKYLQVADSGVQDPRVYYNLGNACFKAGRLGEAILWYERALRLAPRDPDIRANLRFAEQHKQDREPSREGIEQWLLGIYFFPTLDELSLAFGCLFAAICVLGMWRLWQRERARALWLWLFLASAGLAVLAGAFLGTRLYRQTRVVEAIVTVAEAAARSAPDEAHTTVFVLHEGTRVRLERREGEWVLVRLAGGLGGWVPAISISII